MSPTYSSRHGLSFTAHNAWNRLTKVRCVGNVHRMKSFWTIVFGIILISTICAGQVNFTPNWGKRASLSQGRDPECKSPLETVMYIYKILLSEAQKIIDCERLNNM